MASHAPCVRDFFRQPLRNAGFQVDESVGDWSQPSTFRKATIRTENEILEIDWAADSAYRFFPIVQDAILGWRLHLFGMATNKALALAARSATRDYVDIVELARIYPLSAIIWAACGKDIGYSPLLLLDMMRRFARISPNTLATIQTRNLNPIDLKRTWIEMSDQAEMEITHIADTQPDMPIGIAFINHQGEPGWIGNNPSLAIHPPSIRGCWPDIHAPGE